MNPTEAYLALHESDYPFIDGLGKYKKPIARVLAVTGAWWWVHRTDHPPLYFYIDTLADILSLPTWDEHNEKCYLDDAASSEAWACAKAEGLHGAALQSRAHRLESEVMDEYYKNWKNAVEAAWDRALEGVFDLCIFDMREASPDRWELYAENWDEVGRQLAVEVWSDWGHTTWAELAEAEGWSHPRYAALSYLQDIVSYNGKNYRRAYEDSFGR